MTNKVCCVSALTLVTSLMLLHLLGTNMDSLDMVGVINDVIDLVN